MQSVHPRSGKTANGLELTYIGRDGKVPHSPLLASLAPPGLTRRSPSLMPMQERVRGVGGNHIDRCKFDDAARHKHIDPNQDAQALLQARARARSVLH